MKSKSGLIYATSLSCLIMMSYFLFPFSSAHARASKSKTKVNAEIGNTFITPDFAFPQDVAHNARIKLDTSHSSDIEKLRAAIQITIADNIVEPSRVSQSIHLLDSLASTLGKPYASLAYLVEAQLYESIYKANRYNSDNKKNISASDDDDLELWDGRRFRQKILDFVSLATANTADQDVPISLIAPVLEGKLSNFQEVFPTVNVFVASKAIDLLNGLGDAGRPLPLGNPGGKPSLSSLIQNEKARVYDKIISYCHSHDYSLSEIKFVCDRLSSLPDADRQDYLDAYEKYADSPYSLILLSSAASARITPALTRELRLAKDAQLLQMMRQALQRWPDSMFANNVKDAIADITAQRVSLRFESEVLPYDSINVKVTGYNTPRVNLSLYSIPQELYTISDVLKKGKMVRNMSVDFYDSIPSEQTVSVRLQPLTPGYYALVPSLHEGVQESKEDLANYNVSFFHVTDIRNIFIQDAFNPRESRLYVVAGDNMAPISNASIKLKDNRSKKSTTLQTSKEGYVTVPSGSFRATTSYKGSKEDTYIYNYKESRDNKVRLGGTILTSLALYHPGDTLRFGAVLYHNNSHEISPAASCKLRAELRNPNWVKCDSLSLIVDADSRVEGALIIPADAMTGRWSVRLVSENEGDFICDDYVQVADYVAPSFFADLTKTISHNQVLIKGEAITYSGMPVQNAEVDYTITYRPVWRYHDRYTPYSAHITADEDGRFVISLPVDSLSDSQFKNGYFSVTAFVTNQAGETCHADPISFTLSDKYRFNLSAIPERIKVDSDSIRFDVTMVDALGLPISALAEYHIENENGFSLSNQFTTPGFSVPAKSLPSGSYRITVSAADADNAVVSTIVYRDNDVYVPVDTALWVPQSKMIADSGAQKVSVKFGSSYDGSKILCYIYDSRGTKSVKWLDGNRKINHVDVPVPNDGSRLYATFFACHDLKIVSSTVEVCPATVADSLHVKLSTFRDKITPGQTECWTIGVDYGGKGIPAAIMAVMSDKSLNAVAPFRWTFSPRSSLRFGYSLHPTYSTPSPNTFTVPLGLRLNYSKTYIPTTDWELYGYRLYSRYATRGMVMYKSAVKTTAAPMMVEAQMSMDCAQAANGMMMEEVADMESAVDAGTGVVQPSSNEKVEEQKMCEAEHPLAFFMPMLSSADDGKASLTFYVPDYATTWQLQLAAYDNQFHSEVRKYDIVASRPVMVRANLPRFIRCGDKVILQASVMNNTDQMRTLGVAAEIFNPLNGDIISRTAIPSLSLDAAHSDVVAIPFTAPENMNMVAVRFTVKSGDYSDGEQSLLPIRPSSTPVIDAKPFYIAADSDRFETALPRFHNTASVTLQYCDNPVWYCLTALPVMSDTESKSVLTTANSLYAVALSTHIVSEYPQSRTALQYWKEALHTGADSTLFSPLSLHGNLKSVALAITPWVNDAASETQRMSHLVDLLDSELTKQKIQGLVNRLAQTQHADGGWGWTSDMQSSLFITQRVLAALADIIETGCRLKSDVLDAAIKRGVEYCDKMLYANYIKDKKRVDAFTSVQWMYIRTILASTCTDRNIASMHKVMTDKVLSDWKKLDISGKAKAMMLLHDLGYTQLASLIAESLSQYAIHEADGSIYYDNVPSGGMGMERLSTTALVLKAFQVTDPNKTVIQGLRQWLILSKQTLDWGASAESAGVVSALLKGGVQWLETAETPEIYVDSRRLNFSSCRYTGMTTIVLEPTQVSGKTLTIKRECHGPAWGGVIAQYVAPIIDIKAESNKEISIKKRVHMIEIADGGENLIDSNFTLGSRARVELIVTNKSDLQYVAITDERGACLQPVDQLSEYTSSNGIWMYREVLTDRILFLIDFLPKGTHRITYDCYLTPLGEYASGIATVQSLYTPSITAHSAGNDITVNPTK